MKIVNPLKNYKQFWSLLPLIVIFFLLRFPSLFEPYWYGDEGISGVVGHGLRVGTELYKGIWDNKPPLLYLVYAMFDADQFSLRAFSLLFGIGTVIAFFFLARNLLKNQRSILFATTIFILLFGLPTIEGNIANAENFMLLFSVTAGLLIYSHYGKKRISKFSILNSQFSIFIAGFLLGISFLFKIVAIFDFATFISLLFFRQQTSHFVNNVLFFTTGFITPIFLSLLYFFFNNNLGYYIDSSFGQNIDYVGWGNNFFIPQGLLYVKLLFLFLSLIILFRFRNKFAASTLFILIWLDWSMFNAFFSGRPYTHYLLVLVPSFSLLFGILFTTCLQRVRVATLLVLISIYFLAVNFFDYWSLQRTGAYYQNFLSFVQNEKTVNEYQSFFDKNTPRDYEVAEYIKKYSRENDRIFLWGNSAQIYTLSKTLPPGRFSVAYHIRINKKNMLETARAIQRTKPKYIIIMPEEGVMPFDIREYKYLASIQEAQVYERIL